VGTQTLKVFRSRIRKWAAMGVRLASGFCLALSVAAVPGCTVLRPLSAERSKPPVMAVESPLRDETLFSAARPHPAHLPVHRGRQVTFDARSVLYASVSSDGSKMVYVSESESTGSTLWVRSADPAVVLIPQRLVADAGILSGPVISRDGVQVAYAGTAYDAKGDLYVVNLEKRGHPPRRLTGRDTEDGAPSFSPDGRYLYYHRSRPGDRHRTLAVLDLQQDSPQPRILFDGREGSFPAVSPDGTRCVFVSSGEDGGANLWMGDLESGSVTRLTQGPALDLFPAWSEEEEFVYFCRIALDTDGDGKVTSSDNSVIQRLRPTDSHPVPYPVTSASYSAYYPQVRGTTLFFLSEREGVSHVWSLPMEGEIPSKATAADQMELASELETQAPPDRDLTVLGYYRVLERFGSAVPFGSQAAYAIGASYLRRGWLEASRRAFQTCRELSADSQVESPLAEIQLHVVDALEQWRESRERRAENRVLHQTRGRLEGLAERHAEQPEVWGASLLELSELHLNLGRELEHFSHAERLLDRVSAAESMPRELVARAMVLQANLYIRLGREELVVPHLLRVLRDSPEAEEWEDLAVQRILDWRLASLSSTELERRILMLSTMADEYRDSFPKLVMGAWNRIGDLYFEDGEWSKAKDAYRLVLERFTGVSAQRAAARLSLAEILYREERFRQALDLYETELETRPYEDRIYRLAREAYLRRSVSAGEFLYRLGEVDSAESLFSGVLRDDPDVVEAHRGIIKCAAARKRIAEVLSLYRDHLKRNPDHPVILYATGLCLTYLESKASMIEARNLISRAIEIQGQVEYFHQTMGYVQENLETVYGERGLLESALESYQKAYFLNNPESHPENHAHLLLNLGNAYFLLGRYGAAFEHYSRRSRMDVSFESSEAEILFYRRFGSAAFQVREREQPIEAYTRALDLLEVQIQPRQASELFGRIHRDLVNRVLTPAMNHPDLGSMARKLAGEQAEINRELFEVSIPSVGPPPDPRWETYRKAVEDLLVRQERVFGRMRPLLGDRRQEESDRLEYLAARVRDALAFPPRFAELKAEMLDRLGLAYQEAGRWREAGDSFRRAYELNERLGLHRNRVPNLRSASYNAYMEAGAQTGDARKELLLQASEGFRRVSDLVRTYGVPSRRSEDETAGPQIRIAVSLDDIGSTQAVYGFSAEQELRLAEAFLARIHTELGDLDPAEEATRTQLRKYPPDRTVPDRDLFGVSLLYHRSAHLAYARKRFPEAFEQFRHSGEMALRMGNPVSAAVNMINMAVVLSVLDPNDPQVEKAWNQVLRLDRRASRLLGDSAQVFEPMVVPGFHNTMGVYLLRAADALSESGAPEASVRSMVFTERAVLHFTRGLEWLKSFPGRRERTLLGLEALLHLNLGRTGQGLGSVRSADPHFETALEKARTAFLPQLEWRALLGLGRLDEALQTLESVNVLAAGCAPGEILAGFSPLVTDRVVSGEVEEAFNLLERLSEIERVHRLAPLFLRHMTPKERTLLREAYPRIRKIHDLERRADSAEGNEKTYLLGRLHEERTLLDQRVGSRREHVPSVVRLEDSLEKQDRMILYLGLAAHLEALAEDRAGAGAMKLDSGGYREVLEQYLEFREELRSELLSESGPGPAGILVPAPVETIDVMESLPEGGACLRVFNPLGDPARWIVFRISSDEIEVRHTSGEDLYPSVEKGRNHVLIYEYPSELPEPFRFPLGLNATHWVRSVANRKPFKRNLVEFGSGYAIPEFYRTGRISSDDSFHKALEVLPGAHTLLLGAAVFEAASIPTRPGETPHRYLAMEWGRGTRVPLVELVHRLAQASLVLLPVTSAQDVFAVGHVCSVFGIPTLLVAGGAPPEAHAMEEFLDAYSRDSAWRAMEDVRNRTGAFHAMIHLGFWGLNPEESSELAGRRFVGYVNRGVSAFGMGRFAEASAFFESALNVAQETEAYRVYVPELLKWARESAHGAQDVVRAVGHAQTLAVHFESARPRSEAHAEALLKLGLLLAQAERYDEAIPKLEESVTILSHLDLGAEQVAALADLGVVLENATEYDRALVRFEAAASLSGGLNQKELQARQRMNIGRILDLRLSQFARARQNYEEAYTIFRELDLAADEAQALLDMGRCHRLLGDFREADRHYDMAMERALGVEEGERLRAKIRMEQGNNAWFQARYQEAFDRQQAVYEEARSRQWSLEQVIALNTGGLIWWSLGDYSRALRELERALEQARALRIRRDETATTLNNLGLVYRDRGRYEEALATLDEAIVIDRELKSVWALAYDLRNKAATYLHMGRAEKAVPFFEEALTLASGIGDRVNMAKTLAGLGEARFVQDRDASAREAYEEALALAGSLGTPEIEWRALYGLALIHLKSQRKAEARPLLARALEVIEQMRAEIKLDQLKDGFITNKMSVYETMILLLLDLGEFEEAFDTAERSRARNLIDLLGNQRLNLHGAVEQDLYDREATLKSRIREQESLLAQAADEQERTVYRSGLERLQDEYRDLMLKIQRENPELATLVSVSPLGLKQIRELLDPGVTLLSYYVAPREILCWVVSRESVVLTRNAMPREVLEKDILDYRRMIQNLEPLEELSQKIYESVFAQVVSHLAGTRVLGIVPHGPLHYLSFATLSDGRDYLVDRFPMFHLPSAGVIPYTMDRRMDRKNLRVLAIGNPDLDSAAMDLPFAEREVATIGWNFPDITILTRERATESWVVRNIGDFGIIHLASHGEFDPINPLFSAVKLAPDIHADGNLEAMEVFGLRIRADLVVLSACQTGLGEVRSGDDVIGMNRAFLYAGTHAIVSSLWRVSDISTGILIKQFYREYARENKSTSLRRAMLHVKNRSPHPGYWGGFVLVGDYL